MTPLADILRDLMEAAETPAKLKAALREAITESDDRKVLDAAATAMIDGAAQTKIEGRRT